MPHGLATSPGSFTADYGFDISVARRSCGSDGDGFTADGDASDISLQVNAGKMAPLRVFKAAPM